MDPGKTLFKPTPQPLKIWISKIMYNKFKNFLRESKQEFKRINWPSRQETVRYTLFVIGFSLVLAVFLGLLDFAFLYLLNKFFIK